MKQRLSKKDRTGTSKTKSGRSKQSWFFNSIGLLFILVVVGYFFAPYASMHFQNNNAATLNDKQQRVMFYSAQCSDCANVYPKVFWHNVLDFDQPSKQIQTINLDAPTNKHFIAEKGLIATPTFMNLDNNTSSVITNSKDVNNYVDDIDK
ncbi:hypothetical protein WOSG25_190110 [Weissella oryzae SG25]|uniref:Thioredoxin domain-containing protein n=1 Tax=Weissella oryzae (strain DSM 25784 / JCM 18191 / LMG 30913 / SG25) TaxID=1329250 RepID=A0A069CXF4_WEIOS|nr:hypothetical protein [Weissella oryzae]GAK31903.1 hypothetical protein WOSG25_190110 [Weissella oryzae SG25]